MDKIKFLSFALLLAICVGFVSCKGDKEGGFEDFDTPKYEEFSAKYVIETEGSDIESIELTASGNYIITKSYYSYYSTYNLNCGRMLLAKPHESRGYGMPIYGKYTKVSDTEFKLEGFGTIKINGSTDDAYSLTIEETGEEPYVLTAAKKTQYEDSAMTNALCRTWEISTLGLKYVINGKTIFDKTVDSDNIRDLAASYVDAIIKYYEKIYGDEIYEDEEYEDIQEYIDEYIDEFANSYNEIKPEQVVFTKSGTYMVYYSGSELAISTWTWDDMEKGILRYSWSYDDMYDDYASGKVTVSFKDGKLYITESESESEDGESYKISFTYGMTEVK